MPSRFTMSATARLSKRYVVVDFLCFSRKIRTMTKTFPSNPMVDRNEAVMRCSFVLASTDELVHLLELAMIDIDKMLAG